MYKGIVFELYYVVTKEMRPRLLRTYLLAENYEYAISQLGIKGTI